MQFLQQAREHLKQKGTVAERVDREAWDAFARVLLRLNEFVYLD